MKSGKAAVLLKTLLCFLFVFAAGNQSAGQGLQTTASPFLQTHWTTENGLPQNTVTAIAQTRDGYLWLGTFGGLARFDGVKFTIFNSANTPGLISNRFTSLYVDNEGLLWIGTEAGEVLSFQDGQFQFYTRPDAGEARAIQTFYRDRAGTLWAGGDDGQLIRINPLISTMADLFPERGKLAGGAMRSIFEDSAGQLWVGTSINLALLRGNTLTIIPEIKGSAANGIVGVCPHPDGGLWIAMKNVIGRFLNHRFTPYINPNPHPAYLAGLAMGKEKTIWLSYGNDHIYGLKGDQISEFKLLEKATHFVCSLLEDREGNIWVGTSGDGLIRLRKRRVTMITTAEGLPAGGAGPILEDAWGNMWIGTDNGFCQLSQGKLRSYFTRSPKLNNDIWNLAALYMDKAGFLWIGKDNSIARFKDGKATEYWFEQIRRVFAITEDSQGRMWLGTQDGLAHFRDGKIIKIYKPGDGLVHNHVCFIMEDRSGALWLGTTDGLSRFKDGVFTNYTTRDGLSNGYVRAIYEDQDGALWLGTYGGGLNRLKDGRITQINTQHGLFDDFVSRMLVDESDQFWMLGNRGIFRVSRSELNDVAEGHRQSLAPTVFDTTDGMIPSEGNGGCQPAGWLSRDGKLWFPTIGGVAVVDPHENPPKPPSVEIERVLLDGGALDLRRPIEIGPGRDNLEIHYTGLSLSKPEQIRFRYRLSGLRDDWVDVGTQRITYFPRLRPGKYKFSVMAISADGIISDQEASLEFFVEPSFWQTIWFQSLAVMMLAGLLLAVYRWRVSQYRRKNLQQEIFARQLITSQERERKRIAAELHDGLSQSLVIIKRRAMICLEAADDQERTQEHLQEIAEASTQVINEVKEIVFDLHPQQLDRLGLTGAISDLLDRIASVNNWQLTKRLDELDGVFPKDAENSLYRIVQESVNNISKHAEATNVMVSLWRKTDQIELILMDDGKGFAVYETVDWSRQSGFGLKSIFERAKLLGGQATIESIEGQGTEIRLRLPLTNRYDGNIGKRN